MIAVTIKFFDIIILVFSRLRLAKHIDGSQKQSSRNVW